MCNDANVCCENQGDLHAFSYIDCDCYCHDWEAFDDDE